MEAWGASEIDTTKMTMAEYKQYIAGILDSIPFDASRMYDEESIYITEEGWEQMKNDPEYENWVLDYIRRDMAVAAPGWYTAMGGPSAYCILNFGATKEERTGEMFSAGYMNGKGTGIFNSHADKSFWTKRSEQKKIQERIDKKAAEKKDSSADDLRLAVSAMEMRMAVLSARMAAPKKGDRPELLQAEYMEIAEQLRELKRR